MNLVKQIFHSIECFFRYLGLVILLASCSSGGAPIGEMDTTPEEINHSNYGGLTISWEPASEELMARALSSGKVRRVAVQSKWNLDARVYSIPVPGDCIPKKRQKQSLRTKQAPKKFSSSGRYTGKAKRLEKPDICAHHLIFAIGSKYDTNRFVAYDLGEFGELKGVRSHYDREKDEAFIFLTVAKYPRRVVSRNKQALQETKQFRIQVFPDASASLR